MRKFPRFLKVLPVLALVLVLLTTAAMAAEDDFDKDTFVGLVLQNNLPGTTKNDVAVSLYKGFGVSSSNLMTPVYTEMTEEGVELSYYEVTANTKYTCKAKTAPADTYTYYTDYRNIYISAEEATQKTVLDVTPAVRTTNGWDPSSEIRYYTDEVLEKVYPSSPDLWPQYADFFTTPGFDTRPALHKQTTQTEMMNFINGLNMGEDNMYVYILGQSAGTAYDIPLVIFTKTDLSDAQTLEEAAALVKANGKLTVHYQAQIHGNEPAAGEAALGMIQRLDGAYGNDLLDSMNIYVIPRLNPYGAYKSVRGVSYGSSTTDPNRDFMRLSTTEVTLRMKAYNLFDPEVVLDGHEYQVAISSTSVQQVDIKLCSHFMPTFTQEYQNTALALAGAAFKQLKSDDLAYSWYGNSVNGIGGNTGSSNTAFRASLHILMETDGINRGLQNYERRVASHASAMTGMFAYLNENAEAVKATVRAQRDIIVENGKTYKEGDIVLLDGTNVKPDGSSSTLEEWSIEGHNVNLATGATTATTFPAKVSNVIKRSRTAPTAYVISAGEDWAQTVLDRMDRQGITYDFIPEGASINLQQYTLTTLSSKGNCTEAGLTDEQVVTFPNGAYAFTMDQVDALILGFLMEPDVSDAWNSDAEMYMGTFVYDNVIPTPTEVGGTFPIYRYIRDLNAKGEIDYASLSQAPEGLTAVDATKIGGTGKITGLDATKAYEYRAETEGSYTAVPVGATEIADLPVGKYYVRFAATEHAEASADTLVEIGYGVLDEYVVYLDATNGVSTNDGYTEAAPVNTIDLAYSQLTALMESAPAGTTGKIVIIGTYTLSGSQYLPSHEYPLLITGGTLKFYATSSRFFSLGGDTTFDEITLALGTNSYEYYLCAEGHKLVMGENVTCTATSSNYYPNICGGGQASTVAQSDVTVKSGNWQSIYVGGYSKRVSGDTKVVLSNCNISRVAPSYTGTTGGNVYMSLKNVTVRTEIYCGNTKNYTVSGNVTLVLGEGVTSPKLGNLPIYAGSRDNGNITGTVTVIADGIDLETYTINGTSAGTIGGLKLVLNKGQLVDVADTFVTRDGVDIVLGCDQTEAAALAYSCNLDLNGNDATITVAEGKTLTVCDTATDDFKVLDAQGYGILSATGNAVAKEGYLVREETTGKSYHRKSLELGGVTLRPAIGGIYYTGQFGINEVCRDNVACYGVVLSIKENPELDKEGCEHSTLTTWPQNGAGHGTVLSGIMKKDGGFTANSRNAATKVYGVAYIKYTDGTVEYSDSASFSLQYLVEQSDTMWKDLTQDQKDGLLELYSGFKSVMKFWNIPNIKAA